MLSGVSYNEAGIAAVTNQMQRERHSFHPRPRRRGSIHEGFRMTMAIPAWKSVVRELRGTVIAAAAIAAILMAITATMAAAAPQKDRVAQPSLDVWLQVALQQAPHVRGPVVTRSVMAGKVVLVPFFASWCIPCRAEFKALEQMLSRMPGQPVTVIAVNIYENFDKLSDEKRLHLYLNAANPSFSIVKVTDAILQAVGRVPRIPTLFVFAPDGRLARTFINTRGGGQFSVTAAKLQAVVSELL